MTQSLFTLLQKIEEIVDTAGHVPLVGKVMVDPDDILDIVERLRAALPEEVHEAEWITRERERILAEAAEDAERVRRDAQEQLNRMVGDHRLTHEAQLEAARIIADGRQEAARIRNEAGDFADRLLGQIEQGLTRATELVRDSREALSAADERR